MRKLVVLPEARDGVRRIVLYDDGSGAYLFLRSRPDDGPCEFDEWYVDREIAEASCAKHFGVKATDWTTVDDPLPGCQHDCITPTKGTG